MKIKFIPALIATAIGFAAAQSAFATDGTIDFLGEITANTCTVKLDNNSTGSGTVTLPSVSVSAFPTTGSVTGATAFNIALSACSITSDTTVSAYFEPGALTNLSGRLSQSHPAGASGVEIQLLNSEFGVIDASASAGNQNDTGVPILKEGTSATLTYYAQYYSTGAITAGPVSSQANYSIVYD